MAYCKQCGAYIPDGQTVCLACGFDEAAQPKEEPKAQAATQAAPSEGAYSYVNAELRDKLEQQRKAQQEKNREWAEQEHARRQRREENRKWAQEELARRRAAQEQQGEETPAAAPGAESAGENKLLAALSYLSVLFILPYILTPKDQFARYHAKQGLILFIAGVILDAVGAILPLGWVVTLARLYFIYKGMSAALNGQKRPLPFIGSILGDT